MDGWWYSLNGEADGAHAWAGAALPEGTDFTRVSFINQFVRRINNRLCICHLLGGNQSTLPLVEEGDYLTGVPGFVSQFRDAAALLTKVLTAKPQSGLTTKAGMAEIAVSELCISEFATLDDVDAGEVFWRPQTEEASGIFEAMYSIIEKAKIFHGTHRSIASPFVTRHRYANLYTVDGEYRIAWSDTLALTEFYGFGTTPGYRRYVQNSVPPDPASTIYYGECVRATDVELNYGQLPADTGFMGADATVYGYGDLWGDGGVGYDDGIGDYPTKDVLIQLHAFDDYYGYPSEEKLLYPADPIGTSTCKLDGPDTAGDYVGYDIDLITVMVANDSILQI